ncbi:hypothetical protein DEU56DRAFT_979515 [Suillus clintonianus]|uniref:uncharacterized protein n=1 Tax=Suillus clintonianus TaxID=1904413 RepID=UPI001B885611|nr:uncharacterized protein DEU56DRAFT_979515 [Suillus clintonianus]KAG2143089.1 hypothetical protein DEU56DRAFT_979515 [Suillus clintonianus]
MVASKTKKSSKYTYAERVLSAFSQAQKEHRRHSVHLATLRAHVRKIAKDRKDRLGPQWASWVGKAVKKLEDQGVLHPVDSSGYVGMTPEGKKVLSYARRKLLPTATGDASPAQEDAVWKNVTEHFSPSVYKRHHAISASRLKSVLGEEEVEEDSASVRGSPRAKRQRRAPSPVKPSERSLTKMTKAELQTKVRELQKAKLMDQQLKAQLADREEQLGAVQDELRMLKLSAEKALATMHEEELTELDDQEFQHSMDEELPAPDFSIFDVQTPRAGTPAGQGAGVTRTQSGSIIHDISMRPTPAPSSPDLERDRRYRDDENLFTDQHHEHLRTPESLPDRRASQTDEQQLALANTIDVMEKEIAKRTTEIQTLKDTVTRLQNEYDTLTGAVDNHKSRIIDLEGETEHLRAIINELESGKRDLQQCLADRDHNVIQLQNAVLEHEQVAVKLNETLAQKEASLNAISIEAETLTRSNNEIISGVQGIKEEMAAARGENRRLTDELASSLRAKEILRERMVELVRTTEERQGELAQALSVAQNEAGHGAVLAQELLVMTEATSELEKQLSKANSTATALDAELAEVLGRNGQLELALDDSRKEIEELKSRITFAEMREAELSSKLFTADATRQSLEDAVAIMKNASRVERVKAQSTVLGLLEKIDGLQIQRDNEVRGFASRITAYEDEVEDLQLNLRSANEAQQSALAAINKSKHDFVHLENSLTAEQATCNGLRVSLTEAREQISSLRVAKTACESAIANLKAVYDQGKRMQTDWMSGMESTFASAQPASLGHA